MMIFNYESKKVLKENVGQHLRYTETSLFGNEYVSNGRFCGSNRPNDEQKRGTGKREYYAEVTMVNDLIAKVK